VKPNVIWRDMFWSADEANSVYARAVTIVSAECHSPIMALSQGTPAFYVRNPVDTVKGQMFRDLGLADWNDRWAATRTILSGDDGTTEAIRRYGVDYVVIGPSERLEHEASDEYWESNGRLVFTAGDHRIYAVD